jgi:cell division protein FtsI (penicillin-binding protein 3)
MSNIRRHKPGQVGHHRQQKVSSARTESRSDRDPTTTVRQSRSVSLLNVGCRLVWIWLVLGLGSLGLLSRLVWLQVVRAPNLQQVAQRQQTIAQRPFVPRRTIVDRSNNQLAIDRPSYTIYAHPSRFGEVKFGRGLPRTGLKVKIEPVDMAERIAPILGLTVADLVAKFQKRKTGVPIGNGIAEEVGNRLKALKLEGLDITQGEADYTRFYPQNDLVAEFLGYLDWEHKARSGVELSQSLLLERKVAQYQLTKSGGNKGSILPDRVTPDFLHTDDLKLRLTVDLRLQRATKEALRKKMDEWHALRGTAIVMDADTGAIRAMVVAPTYNPNQYARDVKNYSKVVGSDRASTLLQNAAVSDLYEPGSTFKPIAVAIALENRVIDRHTKLFDSGSIVVGQYTIRNSDKKGNGELDISQILQHSSNVGMVKIMQRVKPDLYYD